MPFQFQCPQGHLLEGDESQAGQQCHCPTCGMLFIIPQPIAAQPAGSFTAPAAGGGAFRFSERFEGIDQGQPQLATPEGDPSAPYVPAADPAAAVSPTAAQPEPELLHIPCPNGHELETPVEMLDQDVLCPQCNAQFRLRRKDSVEFKKKKEQDEAIRLEKVGRLWLNWAIVAIVLVVLIFIGLILFSNMSEPVAPK
jgi:rubredoxin